MSRTDELAKARKSLAGSRMKLDVLDLLHRTYVAKFGELEGLELESFQEIRGIVQDLIDLGEQRLERIENRLEWMHYSDAIVTGRRDGKTYLISARYSKNADRDGFYHWYSDAGEVSESVGGARFNLVREKFSGKFKRKKSAISAAEKKRETLIGKYAPKPRKSRTPKNGK